MLALGIVEEVIPEPAGGAHLDMDAAARALGAAVSRQLADLAGLDGEELRMQRAERFRALGAYSEV